MKRILILLCFACTFLVQAAYTPQTVPNPKQYCANCFVSNPDAIFSVQAEHAMNTILERVKKHTEVEVAVVAIQSIENDDYVDFANKLFKTWGIGTTGKNTGLLILFVLNERAVKIETGYGLEGLLPDAICKRILTNVIFPPFKEGNYDAGMIAGLEAIEKHLTTQEALEELLLDKKPATIQSYTFGFTYLIISLLVFIALVLITDKKLQFDPKASNNIRYNHISNFYKLTWIFAVLFPLPILFFVLWLKKKCQQIRKQPFKCPECSALMTLLTEQQEDAYLNAAQQKEETLKSVDYDVWECKSCFNHLVFPYHSATSKYKECPKCKAKTYYLHSDVVRVNATQFRAGQGEKTYICANCSCKTIHPYVIPQIIVVAGSGGRQGGGFSGGGGSWGGGFSGGGGAGGRF